VQHQAKRCLIDFLAVTLAGSADPSVAVLCAATDELYPGSDATILGRGRESSTPAAALINGYSAHVLDFDDTYNPPGTTVHPSAPVWPVVVAMSERKPVNGLDALAAFVAGFETEIRVALAAGPAHYEAGWHVTGTVGPMGASAAAAQLLQLGPTEVANALGAAGTQAAGFKSVYGSMGKALHPAKAAMDGLLAAFLADNGFTATDTILEAKNGFLQVLSPAPQEELVTKDLGKQWTLLDDGFKPYACGSLTHPTIEGIIHLREQHKLSADQIESIDASVNDYVSWVTAKEEPTTGLEAKFSIYQSAAVAALDGAASMLQFEDERVNSPDVIEMRRKVSIIVDDSLPKDAASVALTLTDGRRLTCDVMHNKGTPGKPMSDSEMEAKFLDLAEPLIGAAAAREVAAKCWRAEDLDDFGNLARLCRGRAQ
jgi:2-methylcitrate dehydratase PrpD